ncbi:phosphotransferase [Kytococcus sp. Marseille-QA3725]
MAAWSVAAVPSITPREVAWVAPDGTDHEVVQVRDTEGRTWSVRRTVGEPPAGERLAARLPSSLAGTPPEPAGRTTLADGSTVTVRPWAEGRPLRWVMVRPGDAVAGHFATFLATLHSTPVEELTGPDGETPSSEDLRAQRLDLLDRAAATGLVPPRLLARWEESLEDTDLWEVRPSVVHGRLVDEHVLATPDHELSAVMGWSGVHVGDPAEDFAVLSRTATPDVVGAVRSRYEEQLGRQDERLLERAHLVDEMHDLARLVEAHRRGDRAVVEEVEDELSHRARLLAEAEELDSWE